MKPPIRIKQEYEFVKRQTKTERVIAALRALGGFATVSEIAKQARMARTDARQGISYSSLVRIPEGWLLPDAVERCPGCHQPWPTASSSSASAAARGPRTPVVTPARVAAEPAFERKRE